MNIKLIYPKVNMKEARAMHDMYDTLLPEPAIVDVIEIGSVCVYCGSETSDMCCGEMHHEMGYETIEGELVLESELGPEHRVIE